MKNMLISVTDSPIVVSLFSKSNELSLLMSTVRSVNRKRIHIVIYVADMQSMNCVNQESNGTIYCKYTKHVLYPINRLRNLGLRKINGYVLDLDADILPLGKLRFQQMIDRKCISQSEKID